MLFQSRFHDAIRRGEIRCTVRFWERPRVRVGGTYRVGSGAVRVDRIHEIQRGDITPALARRAGFDSVPELLKVARHGAGEHIIVIDFCYVDAPARPRPHERIVDAEGLAAIERQLQAIDRRALEPWARRTLRAIWRHPGLRSTELAQLLGRERLTLKQDIRKLKALGLTISLDVGYRLSAIGVKVLQGRRV